MSDNRKIIHVTTSTGSHLEVNFLTGEIAVVTGELFSVEPSVRSRNVIATIPKGVAEADIIGASGEIVAASGITATLPTHADEAAAVTATLTTGQLYVTATGEVRAKL